MPNNKQNLEKTAGQGGQVDVIVSGATEQWKKLHSFYGLGDIKYEVGDIVTRDGTDEHEILEIDYDWITMTVKCIKEPKIWEGSDEPWIKLGEEESNLIRRYELIRKRH